MNTHELPMILFTVIAQLSVGTFIAVGVMDLLLSHRNDELPLWAHMGVQTVLCGHGHGGIVRLPGIGAVFGTHMDLFPDYTAGLYEKDGTAMVVSRGLGGSRKLPLRIGNRPEVVTVVLQTEN